MRYRIVIEIDTSENRDWVNTLANHMLDEAVTKFSNPVYLATEVVTDKQRSILREVE